MSFFATLFNKLPRIKNFKNKNKWCDYLQSCSLLLTMVEMNWIQWLSGCRRNRQRKGQLIKSKMESLYRYRYCCGAENVGDRQEGSFYLFWNEWEEEAYIFNKITSFLAVSSWRRKAGPMEGGFGGWHLQIHFHFSLLSLKIFLFHLIKGGTVEFYSKKLNSLLNYLINIALLRKRRLGRIIKNSIERIIEIPIAITRNNIINPLSTSYKVLIKFF